MLAACNAAPGAAPGSEPPPAVVTSAKTYGQPVTAGTALDVAAVVADPDAHAGQSILVEGAVRRACTRKGCWMELAHAMDDGAPGCRVTFKDYGFFVPTDSPGSRARVQGEIKTRDLSVDEVAHMEREGAKFPAKQADGTVREVRMVATGVELRKL